MRNRDCREIDRYLSRFIDRELSAEETEMVEEHLATCDLHSKTLDELRAVSAFIEREVPEKNTIGAASQRLSRFVRTLPTGKPVSKMEGVSLAPFLYFSRTQYALGTLVLSFVIGLLAVNNMPKEATVSERHSFMVGDTGIAGGRFRGGNLGTESDVFQNTGGFGAYQEFGSNVNLGMGVPMMAGGGFGGGLPPGGGIPSLPPTLQPVAHSLDLEKRSGSVDTGNTGTHAPSDTRKVIRNAQVGIEVDNVSSTLRQIDDLLARYQGTKANSDLVRTNGSRTARQTVWVPNERLDAFLKELNTLGDVTRLQVTANDIADQYFDREIRIRNLKKQEERLLALYEREDSKLEEVLKVENEIARVRTEIERLEGGKRVWDRQIALSTVNISIHPAPEKEPIVESDAGDVFSPLRRMGWNAGAVFLYSCSIIATGAAWILSAAIWLLPWFAIFALGWLLTWSIIRRR